MFKTVTFFFLAFTGHLGLLLLQLVSLFFSVICFFDTCSFIHLIHTFLNLVYPSLPWPFSRACFIFDLAFNACLIVLSFLRQILLAHYSLFLDQGFLNIWPTEHFLDVYIRSSFKLSCF